MNEVERLKKELQEAKNTIVNVRKERGARVLELKNELAEARSEIARLNKR
jgi:ribosomal protein L29